MSVRPMAITGRTQVGVASPTSWYKMQINLIIITESHLKCGFLRVIDAYYTMSGREFMSIFLNRIKRKN